VSPLRQGLSQGSAEFLYRRLRPLEVAYDYDAVGTTLTRQAIMSRPRTMWRYHELLPIDGAPTVGRHVGGTPLIRADRLAKVLGVSELYIKNDAVNHPSLSFKDRWLPSRFRRPWSSASRRWAVPRRGTSPAAWRPMPPPPGLEAYVLIPDGLEQGKVLGATIYGAKVIAIEGNYDTLTASARRSPSGSAGAL